MLPKISPYQETMAKNMLSDILSTPDGPTFQENIINPEIIEESLSNYYSLNLEQNLFCDNALNTILENSGQQFLGSLDAVAGTGKTFTLNVLIANLKAAGKKVFAAAYAGIAGALLIGGSTFYSQTNAPQDPAPNMVLGMERNTENASI